MTNKQWNFSKISQKNVQDKLFHENEYESLCNVLKKYVDVTKI